MQDATKLLGSWGITVTLAWLITQLLDWYPDLVSGAPVGVERVTIGVWTVLMLPPLYYTVKTMYEWQRWAPFLLLWIGITVVGMAQNTIIANIAASDPVELVSYVHLWFGLCAVGFAYNAAQFRNHARTVYGSAAVLNATAIPAVAAVPALMDTVFIIAAIIQGLPMLVDLALTYRTKR